MKKLLLLPLAVFPYSPALGALLSSSVSVFALAKNMKNNKLLSAAALICRFFFCADIISLFVLRRTSKKRAL